MIISADEYQLMSLSTLMMHASVRTCLKDLLLSKLSVIVDRPTSVMYHLGTFRVLSQDPLHCIKRFVLC